MFLWSSSRGKTRPCRARMRRSSPRTWRPTSCRDTRQNRSHPHPQPPPPSPPSLLCTPETHPHHKRICSDPSWIHRLPSTLCCTACGRQVPLGTWMCPPGTAGGRWSARGLHLLHDLATPPLLEVPRLALPARPPPPPPPPLMRSGRGCHCLGSVFLLMARPVQTGTTTTDRRCTNRPDGRVLHLPGSSPPPTPNTPRQTLSPHPACGSTEVL